MIVDSHAHIFPPLAGACGFADAAEHRRFLQLYIQGHGEPVHRLRDDAIVPEAEAALTPAPSAGWDGLPDANFRVGRYGRFEWDWQDETYYRSFLPPSLQEMVSPPEFLLQAMARAGVDRAILQNARPYGRLNDEFAAAVARYPEKFIGLADVVEAAAHTPEECARLTSAVRELGLRGVYYANRGLFPARYEMGFDDPRFDGYWQTVAALGIPVFWEIAGVPSPSPRTYLTEIARLDRWCQRFPAIPAILTHGVPVDYLCGNLPEPLARLFQREQMMFEVLYPIHWGQTHDYPYNELQSVLQTLLTLAGSERLVWGSDMPNVERNCTYRQSLTYLSRAMREFSTAADLDAILGGNVLRLVGTAGD